MTTIINKLSSVILYDEVLTKSKYETVMTNESNLRKYMHKYMLDNHIIDYLDNIEKSEFLYYPADDKILNSNLKLGTNKNIMIPTWIDLDIFKECGNNIELFAGHFYNNDIRDKETIVNVNGHLMLIELKNPHQLANYIEFHPNRYITLPLMVIPNFKPNDKDKVHGHIGLYVIDKFTNNAYFFDPNGKPSYFEDLKYKFKEQNNNTDANNNPRANTIFDDIELTFNEYSFLTNHHMGPFSSIINSFLKHYTKLVSENLTFVENNNFYKFIPNSNMLSADFDLGSCVTWTLIMDHLLQICDEHSYEYIIEQLCNLTIIDSQRTCYGYQCGLYNMLNTVNEIENIKEDKPQIFNRTIIPAN